MHQREEAGRNPALPRNCKRNEIHTVPLVFHIRKTGKAWRVGELRKPGNSSDGPINFIPEGERSKSKSIQFQD